MKQILAIVLCVALAPPPLLAAPVAKATASKQASGKGAANRTAVESTSGGYVSAVQIYPWTEGAIYRLSTAPGMISDVALQPGEQLVSVAAGDTVRWVIGDTTSGSGAARRTHILVKPVSAGLRTNLIITTDRRVYLLAVESRAAGPMVGIAWSYAEDAMLALTRARALEPIAGGITIDRLNFNYRIEGMNPAWRPVRAFDDGQQVFIEFPPSLTSTELPPLFVVDAKGGAELVNYRLRGRYYVVDRLFASAELRLGAKKQQIVRITRGLARGKRS